MGDGAKSVARFLQRTIHALTDGAVSARGDAARALGVMERAEALPALRARLGPAGEAHRGVQREIRDAIARIERANPGVLNLPRAAAGSGREIETLPRAT